MDCVTPSNPHGIERGYGILPGNSDYITSSHQWCHG